MKRAWSGLLAVAMMGTMAASAQAQAFFAPFEGDWSINIPQEPYGPAVWTFKETAGVVTSEIDIDDVPGFAIHGELTGQKLFTGLYLLNSEFKLDDGIEEVPNLTATNVAIVFVFMGRAQGYAITTIEGVPFAIYEVVGQKE